VGAGAKSQARVESDDLPGLFGRLVPSRHDPEIGGHLDRRKLRLGQTHPVLVFHGLNTKQLAVLEKVLSTQQNRRLLGRHFLGKQGHHA
jgi:hypothetical protein